MRQFESGGVALKLKEAAKSAGTYKKRAAQGFSLLFFASPCTPILRSPIVRIQTALLIPSVSPALPQYALIVNRKTYAE